MRYRVRGPLHTDPTRIAEELRGLIAHTGPIRLGYLQMHGVAAHTLDVRDDAAAFVEETLLPKIGAAESFIEQRTPLRQPKELTLAATLAPTTATGLPDLSGWAGVWSEVVYGPRATTVRLRGLPEDADRLTALAGQGWRVQRGPLALLTALLAPLRPGRTLDPQFWPMRAGTAPTVAPSAPPTVAPALTDALPLVGPSAPLPTADVLAGADVPHLLLGVTPTGQGVRLAWRAMIVAVPDGGERQASLIPALLGRAFAQGMGGIVIAERAQVTPRMLAPVAHRLRVIDMADPWESARLPWRTLPPEALAEVLGGPPPSPLPATLAEALRGAGQGDAATPVLDALTRAPAYDLAGTLEAGGGIVLLREPGADAALLAALLILGLREAPLTRPLLICRPADLPIPPSLAQRAVQVVMGAVPTATLHLLTVQDGWVARLPDGTTIPLHANLAAPVVEQAGADHTALVGGLQGLGWAGTGGTTPVPTAADANLGWPEDLDAPETAAAAPHEADATPRADTAAEVDAGMGWPEAVDESAEGAARQPDADEPPVEGAAAVGAGLGWPEELNAPAEVAPGPPDVDEMLGAGAADADAGLDWPEEVDTPAEGAARQSDAADESEAGAADASGEVAVVPLDADAPPALAVDDAAPALTADDLAPLVAEAPAEGAAEHQDADAAPALTTDVAAADEAPAEVDTDDRAPLAPGQPDAADAPGADAAASDAGLDWPDDLALTADDLDALTSGQPDDLDAPGADAAVSDAGLDWPEEVDAPAEAAADRAHAGTEPVMDGGALPSFDVSLWETALGDNTGTPADASVRHRRRRSARRRMAFTPTIQRDAARPDADEAPALVADDLAPLAADDLAPLAADDLAPLAADDLAPLAADDLAPLAADEAPALAADEAPALAADEAGERPDADALPALVAAPPVEAATASADALAPLVAAWRAGASLPTLARALRAQQPALALLDAMRVLMAAIDGTGTVPPQPAPPPAPAVLPHDGLVVLRALADGEPGEPVAQDALRRWQAGDQRRTVVRDLMAAHRLSEADARACYDRVVLPRVIRDLNGSAEAVLAFLRADDHDPQAALPPAVIACVARLLGTPRAHAGTVRPVLPALRETLAALDATGRA
jgi:hypothetical protein